MYPGLLDTSTFNVDFTLAPACPTLPGNMPAQHDMGSCSVSAPECKHRDDGDLSKKHLARLSVEVEHKWHMFQCHIPLKLRLTSEHACLLARPRMRPSSETSAEPPHS